MKAVSTDAGCWSATLRYVGSGYTPGVAQLAAGIAEDLAQNREFARDTKDEQGWGE
ncbi:hypothetical protein [Streptomyces mirabilis]